MNLTIKHILGRISLFFLVAFMLCADADYGNARPSLNRPSPSAEETSLPELVGKPAPPFKTKGLDGKTVSLADYRGKALLLNFWATWCGACKIEMPWLAQLREQYAKQGFEVIGVLTNNAPLETVAALTRKYGVRYPILMCNHSTAQAYGGLPYLPTSFYIDARGRVVAEMAEASSKAEIEANILKALRTHS
jgi:peroxiredoxin